MIFSIRKKKYIANRMHRYSEEGIRYLGLCHESFYYEVN